jgi:hypothetical protein
MNKTFVLLLASVSALVAQMPQGSFSDPKIAVQNTILTKVNGKTISVLDVKKKMDVAFHQSFPQFADDIRARHQFYEMSWRNVLIDMIDNELIVSDALDKEIKLTDGEVREEMENRFGPNVMQTLDKIGVSYDEAWKMLKNEMLVQRMLFWFVQSKAMSSVSPQDIRQAYRLYLEKNPAYTEWKYRVISIRLDKANEALSEKVYELLSASGKPPQELAEELKKLDAPENAIAISNEFIAKDQELSELHHASLADLLPGHYSAPSFQTSRIDKKTVYRIFYLIEKNDHPALNFEDLATRLRDELIQKAASDESKNYITKLRKHYGFDSAAALPEDLHPFALQ